MSTVAVLDPEPRTRGSRLVADPREQPPVGLQLRVETPENVVLAYQLAGPAPRAFAYAIDFLFRMLIFAVLLFMASIGMGALPGLSGGMLLFGLFLLEWGYFVVCEGFFNGRTPGKSLMSLRVIQEKGYAVTMWSVLLRNLLRAADYMLLLAPAFLSMLITRRFQRLGDLVAHTVVVSERVVDLPREPVIVERIAPLRRDEIGSFVPSRATLALIDEFLGRRAPSRIPPERGHRIVSRLARVLSRKLNYQGDRERLEKYPMAFLAQVYVTFARRDDEDAEGNKGRQQADAEDVFDLDDVPGRSRGRSHDLDEIVARDTERRRRRAARARRGAAESVDEMDEVDVEIVEPQVVEPEEDEDDDSDLWEDDR